MTFTMTIPDPPTITAIATLLGVIFTGIATVLNAWFQRRGQQKIREKVAEVHADTKQTVTNTNGQLAAIHAENKALVETNRLLQEQIAKLTPRSARSTDPQPSSAEKPPSGSIVITPIPSDTIAPPDAK